MELRLTPEAVAPATVTCSGCGETIYEDEAQASRWGYWSDGAGDLYPFCIECATHEFASGAPRGPHARRSTARRTVSTSVFVLRRRPIGRRPERTLNITD